MPEINRFNYVESNKDWSKFVDAVSHNTGKVYGKLWVANLRTNRKRVKRCGWAAEDLLDTQIGKTAVLLGASPTIRKQVEQLKELQKDPNFLFLGISSNFKFLCDNGIKPKYIFIADADPALVEWFKGYENETEGVTLISNLCAHPKVLDMWKGDVKYLALYTAIPELDKDMKKWYKPVNGCGYVFPALCSQYNTAVAFAYLVFGCRILIFVGNELGFADKEVAYYVDRKDKKDAWERKPHIDIYGNVAYTNYMLFSLKMALEDFLGKLQGWFFNATEAGIFGVSARYGNLPWIQQFKLDMAVKQAKHIMKYGIPLTLDSVTEDIYGKKESSCKKESYKEITIKGGDCFVRL